MAFIAPKSPGTPDTGFFTVVDYTAIAGVQVSVNGVSITEGIEFTAQTSNAQTAINLAAALNLLSVQTDCTFLAAGSKVNITSIALGSSGLYVIGTSDLTNLSRSGIQLNGGTDPGEVGAIAVTGPSRIKSITFACTGPHTDVQVINGLASTDDEYDLITGTSGQTVLRTYKGGLFLPAGCFILPGPDVTNVIIEFLHI